MFISGFTYLHGLIGRSRQMLFFFFKRMDIVTFFSVAIFLWTSYTPKLSISLNLPQAGIHIFNRSLVFDNISQSVGHYLKGNHLSYLYAPWDAESLRHTDDVELFMGSYFGHLPVTAFSCWRAPCASAYSCYSFPRLVWSHGYGASSPGSFERFPKMLQKAKRIYSPLIQANTCRELRDLVSSYEATPILNYSYLETWPVKELTMKIYEELREIIANFNESNLLLLPHLSTAFPTSNNISDHSPLIFLFTDSHREPDSSYDQDVYMFKSLQLEYTICRERGDDSTRFKAFVPSVFDQQHNLYRKLLSGQSEHCRMTVVCPIWWRKVHTFSSRSYNDSWTSCGLDKSTLPLSTNQSFISVSQLISSSLHMSPLRDDFINLASHLLNNKLNPHETPTPSKSIDGMLAVNRINRLCCEFAVREATDQIGVFDTAKVRARALALIREQVRPRYSPVCSRAKPVNYTHVRTPNIEALGCRRWGNGSLTFATVSIHNPPPWVEVFFGSKSNLPKIAIVDSKAEIVYIMRDSLSYENVATFISHFHNGTLQRHLFSDERVTSRRWVNFLHRAHSAAQLESLIGLESKDVVVLFFGRHCGYTTHGRGALYEFQSAAKHFAHHESLLFVVVDVDTVQLPWPLTVEYVPVIILFPSHRKSNSIVFPRALLSSPDLYSNLVNFLNKRINSTTNSTATEDSFHLVEHLNVHLTRISSAEGMLGGLLQRLVIGLEELNAAIRKHAFQYILATESGRLTLHRLLFTRDRLSFQWRRFVAARDRLVKERSIARTARAHLLVGHI
ncbi:Thioredoxin domain-containing protein [Echinococcus granulosus]|uniref:Thioredoxin domain-containing protein n=1 Tax=Echinococcus granulosus TaxID=6210 RepID=W6UQS9_ECHGR|nr:Thioredoxin domain-containing protein [Echinococcus granulosus]EUB64050.1 Thioredoxin domain-containing protein [Echinococcus granulosus]